MSHCSGVYRNCIKTAVSSKTERKTKKTSDFHRWSLTCVLLFITNRNTTSSWTPSPVTATLHQNLDCLIYSYNFSFIKCEEIQSDNLTLMYHSQVSHGCLSLIYHSPIRGFTSPSHVPPSRVISISHSDVTLRLTLKSHSNLCLVIFETFYIQSNFKVYNENWSCAT